MNLFCSAGGSKHFQRAEAYYDMKQYASAAKYYELALRKDTLAKALEKLANCYLILNEPGKAEFILKRSLVWDSTSINSYDSYASILKMNNKHEQAKNIYRKASSMFPLSSNYFNNKAFFCDTVIKWKSHQGTTKITNLTNINTPFCEISPTVSNGYLIYASNREDLIILPKSLEDDLPYYDLYKSKIIDSNLVSYPLPFSAYINSIFHETAASFSSDGKQIYFSQCKYQQNNDNDTVYRPKLYRSEKVNGLWNKPHTFIFNDSAYSFTHPCIDREGKMFFFSSDIKGGHGGYDLYISLNINEKWTDPINLGPLVNTPGNEIYPYYDSTGTLYFASDYHLGLGGFDIFKATQENGDFNKLENLKSPINSCANDFALYYDPKHKIGYFSSDRKGGKGREDIYLFEEKKSCK